MGCKEGGRIYLSHAFARNLGYKFSLAVPEGAEDLGQWGRHLPCIEST